MDPRERFNDGLGAQQVVAQDAQNDMWTAMPGIVQSFNAVQCTVSVQVSLRAQVQKKDGTYEKVAIPLLNDVPVCFPQGGNAVMTFPIASGDECLVVFAARCIDSWWQSGGLQDQAAARMHSLSDGFAFVGPRSRARPIPGISGAALQLRSADGTSYISLSPATGRVDIVAPGGIYLNGIKFETHRHTGVQAGGSISGGPV